MYFWHFPWKEPLKRSTPQKNDSVADVVKTKERKYFSDRIIFMRSCWDCVFRFHRFFFSRQTLSEQKCFYSTAREFILGDNPDMLADKTVYDLYSGTGTIAQMLAPVCKKLWAWRSSRKR